MKMSRIAYLKFRARKPALTMPSRASTNIMTGIWKMRPMPSINFTYMAEDRIDARHELDVLVTEAGEERHAAGNST